MSSKRAETKFTILFRRTDPSPLEVADILNNQEPHSKAQYIVNAVKHYISCDRKAEAQIDEKGIEAIVRRILREKSINISEVNQSQNPILPDESQNFVPTSEVLEDNGVNAITNALEMFRRK